MKYNVTSTSSPKMPVLGKGIECIKLLLSQTSKDMNQPLVPMLFPILGAHLSGTEFLYQDQILKVPSGLMANLVAESGGNRDRLSNLVKALCLDLYTHDEEEPKKGLLYYESNTGNVCLASCQQVVGILEHIHF